MKHKMTRRERVFALLEGRPVDRLPFYPDISDWYKARRTPPGEPQRYQTGALIPDGIGLRLLPLLAETDFDLMDGCTPAPMTNYRPGDLAAALGEGQVAYCGVPSVLFTQGVGDDVILDSAHEICHPYRRPRPGGHPRGDCRCVPSLSHRSEQHCPCRVFNGRVRRLSHSL